jgi:hypothetical protein
LAKIETSSSSHLAADGVLLGVSIFGGTSFAIVKEALVETSPANLKAPVNESRF